MKISDIYLSLQGEGHLAGKATCFVRVAGCAVKCPIRDVCDEPGSLRFDGKDMSLEQIRKKVRHIIKNGWVCVTGGEPTDHQELEELAKMLRRQNYLLSLQTSGTRRVPGQWDWLAVSPKCKADKLRQKFGNELKLVYTGQSLTEILEYYRQTRFWNYYLMPLWVDGKEKNLEETRDLVIHLNTECNQPWELTLQYHKYYGLP
ncbi:MAG: 7-carboxy-7-deazaguanine synthase QueE [Acidiferrobacterales bacterium]